MLPVNSFLASGDFYRQPITFANSLNPDQDGPYVGPDLDPNPFDTFDCVPKIFFYAPKGTLGGI